jgi:hypothetical protein
VHYTLFWEWARTPRRRLREMKVPRERTCKTCRDMILEREHGHSASAIPIHGCALFMQESEDAS